MALRGVKPKSIEKRLKALFYGRAGVGKTTAAIQFPRPYLIDTERGAENDQYVKLLNKSGGAYFHTTDPEELRKELLSLLSEKHPYKTVVIDPITVIYDRLVDEGLQLKGDQFGRYKMHSDRLMKNILNLLTRLDLNVITTCHAKAKWVRSKNAKGEDQATQDGFTFDGYPKLDYLYDLMFEIEKREDGGRVGVVRKTRIDGFPEGEVFPFSYDEVARRYGKDILERDAVAQALATSDQVARIKQFMELQLLDQETLDKWLDHAGAETISELSAEAAAKGIEKLEAKITPKGEAA
jgi:hypothetical protein